MMESTETKADEETRERQVRRRGFLGLAAGIVVGGAAGTLYHLLAPPKEVEKLTTKTATETVMGTKTITEAQTVTGTETVRATERITETQTVPAKEAGKTTYTVKIKVVGRPMVKTLWPEGPPTESGLYVSSPESFCPVFIVGQEFEVKPGEPPERPFGFNCQVAWDDLCSSGFLYRLGCGEDFPPYYNPGFYLMFCSDPTRPVAFLLQRV